MKCNTTEYSIQEISDFLVEYAAWLYGCGATCTRTTKNVGRIAKVWGITYEMDILPGSIQLTVQDGGCSQVFIKKTPKTGISFYKNTKLSKLSWYIADGKMSLPVAKRIFHKIITSPFTNKWVVLVLTSIANMSFCRIFGGDAVAMAIVFVATLLGFRLKQILLEEHMDVNVVFLFCAFFSSVTATSGYIFHLGEKPDVALGTCVLYLVPGIPYINSISDLLVGQYLVAFSRFMNAVMLTFCLSVGLACGILLMNLQLF